MNYARYTRIIHCRPCCSLLIHHSPRPSRPRKWVYGNNRYGNSSISLLQRFAAI